MITYEQQAEKAADRAEQKAKEGNRIAAQEAAWDAKEAAFLAQDEWEDDDTQKNWDQMEEAWQAVARAERAVGSCS